MRHMLGLPSPHRSLPRSFPGGALGGREPLCHPEGAQRAGVVRSPMNAISVAFVVVLVQAGCSRAPRPAASPLPEPASAVRASSPIDSARVVAVDAARPSVARPAFADCVFHAGEGRKTITQIKRPGGAVAQPETTGSCSSNAECIQTRGQSTPGDGLVDLACEGKRCTCKLQPLVPRSAPTIFQFEIETPCVGRATAKALLMDRCVAGRR
jgi:hypothetical protein